MITVIGIEAIGSFTGWRAEFPGQEQAASAERARYLALAGLAMRPGSLVQETIRNGNLFCLLHGA